MHSPITTAVGPCSAAAAQVAMADKARFWNRIARKYANDPIADQAGYERTLQRVQALLSREHEVLEIGCGTGTTALRLAPATRRLVATDVAEQMIAIAGEKLASQPIPQLEFQLADAEVLVAEQGTYDAVLAFNLLHLVADLPQALSSAINALKPGGLLISKTPCLNEMNPLIPKLALPLLARHRQSAASVVLRRPPAPGGHDSARPGNSVRRAPWLQEQGLAGIYRGT